MAPKDSTLQPLGLLLLGLPTSHVFRVQPSTMEELKGVVEDFSIEMNRELVRKVCASTRDRFEMVKFVKGSYFEHKKKQLKKNLNLNI